MHRPERWQHFLLLISFSVLTWTGFALVYPDHWWARPLLLWKVLAGSRDRPPDRGRDVIGVSIFHVDCARAQRTAADALADAVPESAGHTGRHADARFNDVGCGNERPVLSSHCYIEKMEYWAVVWGTLIMVAHRFSSLVSTYVMQLGPESGSWISRPPCTSMRRFWRRSRS